MLLLYFWYYALQITGLMKKIESQIVCMQLVFLFYFYWSPLFSIFPINWSYCCWRRYWTRLGTSKNENENSHVINKIILNKISFNFCVICCIFLQGRHLVPNIGGSQKFFFTKKLWRAWKASFFQYVMNVGGAWAPLSGEF